MGSAGILTALWLLGTPGPTEATRPPLYVAAPTATRPAEIEGEVAEYVAAAWAYVTEFEVRPLSSLGAEAAARRRACGGRFQCWVESAERLPPRTFYLLVTTRRAADGAAHALLALVDADRGASTIRYVAEHGLGSDSSLDALVFEDAVRTCRVPGPILDAAAWAEGLDACLVQWEPTLAQAGVRGHSGRIEVTALGDGELRLRLDGAVVDHRGAPVRIDRVAVGAHRLALDHPQGLYVPVEATVTVRTASTTLWAPSIRRDAGESAGRVGVRWSGVALGVAGAALLTHALVRDRRAAGSTRVCEIDETCGRFLETGPFLQAPLGYSLILTGSIWSAGSWLEPSPKRMPWWSFVAGALLGGAAYGLSTLAH